MKLSLANAFTLHRKTRSGCDVIVTFLQELKLQYGANKGKAYTEEEDRFILCQVHLLGYGQWDELKAAIRDHWRFRFDWFFKSRTPQVCFTLGGPNPKPSANLSNPSQGSFSCFDVPRLYETCQFSC